MIRIVATVLVCVAVLAGCGDRKKVGSASDEIDFGVVEKSVYRNKYFGLSMNIPPGWSVQDQDAKKKLMDMGRELLSGDDKNLKATLRVSEMQSVDLLTVFKHPVGTPVSFNPNIICVAEQIRHLPGIKRGKDYHFHTKKVLQSSQLKVSFPKEIYAEQIGGMEFDIMTSHMRVAGQTVKQKYYAIVLKGYALVFIVSFSTDEEESELQKVVESIRFQK